MSVFVSRQTKLVVQGITGRDGSFHTKQMLEYGAAMDMGPKRRKQQELALLRLDYGLL